MRWSWCTRRWGRALTGSAVPRCGADTGQLVLENGVSRYRRRAGSQLRTVRARQQEWILPGWFSCTARSRRRRSPRTNSSGASWQRHRSGDVVAAGDARAAVGPASDVTGSDRELPRASAAAASWAVPARAVAFSRPSSTVATQSLHDGRSAVSDTEFGEDVAQVVLHRALRDPQRARDLPIRAAARQVIEHLLLPLRQW